MSGSGAYTSVSGDVYGDVNDDLSTSGYAGYVVLCCMYVCVLCVSVRQCYRVVWLGLLRSHTLLAVEHVLVVVVCVLRGMCMLLYWRWGDAIAAVWLGALSLLPFVVNATLFLLLVFSWAAMLEAARGGDRAAAHARYRVSFLIGNAVMAVSVFGVYGVLVGTSDAALQARLALAGAAVSASFVLAVSVGFLLYGVGLVRSLTRDFASRQAGKLLAIAMAFAACFAGEAVIPAA